MQRIYKKFIGKKMKIKKNRKENCLPAESGRSCNHTSERSMVPIYSSFDGTFVWATIFLFDEGPDFSKF